MRSLKSNKGDYMNAETIKDHIIRLPDVQKITGLSRSTLYKRVKEKTFPDRIELGARAVGWRASEIYEWLNCRQRKGA